MTPKIERFLADQNHVSPFLVVDMDVVVENYERLRRGLPLAHIYYAVKANPAPTILDTLTEMGSCFDAASIYEIDMCLKAGASADRISYGNTVKKVSDIVAAYDRGVRIFAFDSIEEVEKLAIAAPGAKVYCRISIDNVGADWPLSRKFGCTVEMAADLLARANELGLVAYGVSFHVGSQQSDPGQWDVAIARAAMVFTDLKGRGLELKMLNLGGGFPAHYRSDIPDFEAYAETIMGALQRNFGNNLPDIFIEPGRSVVAQAGVIQAEVVLVARKGYEDETRWVYLDIGMFGGLAETMGESIKYQFRTPHEGKEDGPVKIAGPTCDGADIMYETSGYRMPMALAAGDKVQVLATGAYTTTYSAVAFNGFPPLKEFYI